MFIGAQLYTIRQYIQTERDIIRSMKKIAEIGYKTVQISGIGQINPKRLREICDENDLKIVLTHTNPDRILYDTEKVIEEHKILGCDYIGIGSMPEKYRTPDWISFFAEDFLEPAKKIAAAGKLFMYHNHNFEFAKVGEKNIILHLMDLFSPEEMGFTLDTYWVQAGGADVCQWINKLSGRIPVVHIKDMAVKGFEPVMAPIGEGNLNWPAIFEAFKKAGTKYMMVEQDTCENSPFDALQCSYRYLSAAGYR